ncbi:MAG TPA: sulfurtransferase TusA family protein, partial [Polyangia bacterium]
RGQLVTGQLVTEELDLAGEVCPYTFVRAKLRLEELPLGAELHIVVDHAPAAENVPRSLTAEGQEVVSVSHEGARWRIVAIKRSEPHLASHRKKAKEP